MNRLVRTSAVLLGLALLVVPHARVAAQVDQDSVAAARAAEERARDLKEETLRRGELERVKAQALEQREQARVLKKRESQELVKLRRTERELTGTRTRLRTLQRRRSVLDTELGITRGNLQRSILTLNQQRARLARRLRDIYKTGASRELEFLLSTRSFAQLLARWDFVVMVAEQDRLLLEDVQDRKERVQATQHRIEANLTQVQRNARQTETENEKLARLRRERASSVNALRSQRQIYEAAAAELEKTARDIQRLLATLERRRRDEEQRAKSEGRPPEPYTGDFAKGRGALDWPVRGTLVGRFGPEKHPRFGTTIMNNGIDIQSSTGTPVRAAAKGRVEFTNDDYSSFGEVVIVNHGDGYYTLYAHLSEIMVRVGEEVTSGQTIGKVGDSGTSLKGTVLHFEVRKGSSALNPEDWLR
jgi:septal ring factor EnvC (AmiA/AmiB activator)